MPQAPLWLQNLTVVRGPTQTMAHAEALLGSDGLLLGLDQEAADQAQHLGLTPIQAEGWVLGPSLVDPHSVLENPLLGRAETLSSLLRAAAQGGYGQVALLPWADPPRDHPDRLQLPNQSPAPRVHLWGSLDRGAGGQELSPHSELLAAGAVGLASAAVLPTSVLLERSLQLGELGDHPLLLAPRCRSLAAGGLVRQRVEALRGGWPPDPSCSETLPLATVLQLQQAHPQRRLVAMNLSTAEAVAALRGSAVRPQATVHWWQLVNDSGRLHPTAGGWRLEPPLGGPGDRQALVEGLADGLVTAVAVHHQALDAEEQLLPIDQRRAGLAGHGIALPLLWQALVVEQGWSLQQLWQALCWGPCALLGQEPEQLSSGSRQWLLFDPGAQWCWDRKRSGSLAANQPLNDGTRVCGRVRACGTLAPADWQLD